MESTELERFTNLLKKLGIPFTEGKPWQSHQPAAVSIGRQFFAFDYETGRFEEIFSMEEGVIIDREERVK